MKFFTRFVLSLALSIALSNASVAHAGGHQANLPTCTDDHAVIPCQIDANTGKDMTLQMILENLDGYTQIRATGQAGLDFLKNGVIVSLMSETHAELARDTTVVKYELTFSDSLGSDEDFGRYLWTVIATTVTDGYTYKTSFTNTISKL